MPQGVLEQYIRNNRSPKSRGTAPELLTPRQRDILHLLKTGYTNRQIALGLNVSENTVRFHIAKLFSKTGIHDRNAVSRLVAG